MDTSAFAGYVISQVIFFAILCLAINKWGPKKWNLIVQLAITGLVAIFLTTDHFDIHYPDYVVEARWLGWIIGLGVVNVYFWLRGRKAVVVEEKKE